jgi:hypothetical protein
MRFLVYLMSLLFVGTAIAQNPTILQGSYISNVFGQSNFILNPNAQTNIANVTTVTATVTRSTTTPLVATSEFTVAIGTANGTATWATRAFDAGMKGQNCEARFTYRGFAATSKVHIKQGANTVATLNLTPATDPRIASINFPCGDLSAATTFVVTDTAILAGTNEIGGIYTGLATNQANVAQAEFVGGGEWNTVIFGRSAASAQITFAAFTSGSAGTALGKATSAGSDTTITFSNLPAGQYYVSSNLYAYGSAINPSYVDCQFSLQEIDSNTYSGLAGTGEWPTISDKYPPANQLQGNFNFTTSGQRRFRLVSKNAAANGGVSQCIAKSESTMKSGIYIYRFPTSSELVVTPERQNTWGGVVYDDSIQLQFSGTAEPTAFTSYNNATWNKPTKLKGKASVTTTNSGNDLGFSVDQLPVGNYKVTLTNGFYAAPGLTDQDNTVCVFRVRETTTNTIIGRILLNAVRLPALNVTQDAFGVIDGVFTQTSLGQRNFILEASKTIDSSASNQGQCVTVANSSAPNMLSFTIIPLDQPSNSALYVQGPVLGAQTGAAIPAGYVGEEILAEQNSFVTTGLANNSTTGFLTISLTPGVWLISSSQNVLQNSSTGTAVCNVVSDVSTSGNTVTGVGLAATDSCGWPSNNVSSLAILTTPFVYKTTTTKTIYLNSYALFTAGTPSRKGTLRAVRIN